MPWCKTQQWQFSLPDMWNDDTVKRAMLLIKGEWQDGDDHIREKDNVKKKKKNVNSNSLAVKAKLEDTTAIKFLCL